MIGGIRSTQQLFTTQLEQDVMSYVAWWPWGDGQTISIRVGLVLSGTIPDVDAASLQREFVGWFTGEAG